MFEDRSVISDRFPVFLQDDRFVYHGYTEGTSGLYVASPGGEPELIEARPGGWVKLAYAPGFLLHVEGATLFVREFDEEAGTLSDNPRLLVEGIPVSDPHGRRIPSRGTGFWFTSRTRWGTTPVSGFTTGREIRSETRPIRPDVTAACPSRLMATRWRMPVEVPTAVQTSMFATFHAETRCAKPSTATSDFPYGPLTVVTWRMRPEQVDSSLTGWGRVPVAAS